MSTAFELEVRKTAALERIANALEAFNRNIGTLVDSSPFGQNYLKTIVTLREDMTK